MAIPGVSITRYGDEIQGGSPLDVNNTAITYVPTASGNAANRNSVVTDPNGDVWVIDNNGDAKKVSSVSCQSVMDTQTFIATAGQTTFTLINAPSGDIVFSRNGMVISDAAASVTGTTVTYVPANNSNQAMVAGDRVEIAYVYNVCTGGATPTIVDGSETKVIAGTNVTVTGSGTAGNPYVVSTTSAPEAVTYGVAVPTSTAVAGDRYFITSDGTRTGTVVSEWVYDGTGWKQVPIAAATGAGTIIARIANRGVDVIMDNVKVRMNPAGSTLQIAAVSTSFQAKGTTHCEYSANVQTLHQTRDITVTTTYQTVDSVGWNFTAVGARQVFDFLDSTTSKRYRVTMIVVNGYVGNAFTIERLM